MPAFISHSHHDHSTYKSLCAALDDAQVPRCDVLELVPGESLAEQLQHAIAKCNVCIFLATTNSINSPWCHAEVGAFWGAGKRVLVYLGDRRVEESIPPQFRGHLWLDDVHRVVKAAKETIEQTTKATESKAGGYLQTHEILTEADDFQVMHSYYDKSRWIYVCSGDFSWIQQDNRINNIVRRLAHEGSFILESYKPAAIVRENIGDDLFRQISPTARFNSKRRINCSLIEHDNRTHFLYRTSVTHPSGPGRDRICAVTDLGEFAYMLKVVLKQLLTRPAVNANLLLVVGLPASGKSTVAQLLGSYGFAVVSAGDYVRDVCSAKGLEPSAENLEITGRELIAQEGCHHFALELLKRAREIGHRNIVIEGIRPRQVVDVLTGYVPSARVLYVDVDRKVLRRRAEVRGDPWRLDSSHELSVEEIKPMATILHNNGGKKALENNLKEFLVRGFNR